MAEAVLNGLRVHGIAEQQGCRCVPQFVQLEVGEANCVAVPLDALALVPAPPAIRVRRVEPAADVRAAHGRFDGLLDGTSLSFWIFNHYEVQGLGLERLPRSKVGYGLGVDVERPHACGRFRLLDALAAALDWPEERADELSVEVEVG